MRLTPSDTVDHVDLNGSFRRPSSSHEERILKRNLPPASFCDNFALAVFSTFSTESATSRHSQNDLRKQPLKFLVSVGMSTGGSTLNSRVWNGWRAVGASDDGPPTKLGTKWSENRAKPGARAKCL